LGAYLDAAEVEQDGDWALAEKIYGEMLKYLPESSNPVAMNVRSRRTWCRNRRREAERKAMEPAVAPSPE